MATPTATKMTVEGYIAWGERPENAGRKTELVDGEVVDVPPPSHIHGAICYLIARLLARYFDANPPGYATTNDSGLVVARDAVRGVDIAVYRSALRMSDGDTTYSPKVPALCIEVLSPSDRPGMTHKRVQQYLAACVPLVWVVQPDERGVFVHRPGRPVEFLEGDAELTAEAELPGFACRVADFFPPA